MNKILHLAIAGIISVVAMDWIFLKVLLRCANVNV